MLFRFTDAYNATLGDDCFVAISDNLLTEPPAIWDAAMPMWFRRDDLTTRWKQNRIYTSYNLGHSFVNAKP